MAKCTVYLISPEDQIIDKTEYDNADTVLSTYFNRHDEHGNRYHIELNGNVPPFEPKPKKLHDVTR